MNQMIKCESVLDTIFDALSFFAETEKNHSGNMVNNMERTEKNFALRGNICFSLGIDEFVTAEDSWVVCENGISRGVFKELPAEYKDFQQIIYQDKLIIPGLTDLHVHAPQYAFRGLGMDLELIDWLNTNTFPEEMKYADLGYARESYRIFAEDLVLSATTRACIFGTIHAEATIELMELLELSGMKGYVGKVNMDRNSPKELCEKSAEHSIQSTVEWLETAAKKFKNIQPILTPRFIPTCSDELMKQLSLLQKQFHLPMQSHLSENMGEVEWVKELCPDVSFYGAAYDKYGLFGNECRTIMAHCVQSGEEEMELMKNQGVFIAHCPQSNTNLASGIAPVRKFLEKGIKTGLGSDVAGGFGLSIFRAMADAIQCSKLRWRLTDQALAPLKFTEAFYLATKGGGEFFGKVGSFEEGYEFDALVLDDSNLKHPQKLNVGERMERFIYLSNEQNIISKYVSGCRLF